MGRMPEGMHSVHGVAGQAVDRGIGKILEWGNRGEADAYERAIRNSMRDISAAEDGTAPLNTPASLLQSGAARATGSSQGTLDARSDAIAGADEALGLAGAGGRSEAFMKGALEALDEAGSEGEVEEKEGEGGEQAAKGKSESEAASSQLLNAVAQGEQSVRQAVGDPKKDAHPLDGGSQGIRMEPMPGMTEQPIQIGSPQGLPQDLAATTAFAGTHAYNEDVRSLWRERSAAEDRISSLRLRVVEKVNFYESLMKRAELIKADIQVDQDSLKALQAHATAVQARIDRLKGEAAQSELSAQQHQYDMAKSKLDQEVAQMASVRDALGERVQALARESEASQRKETENMRSSLMVDGAAGNNGTGAGGAADAATTTAPAGTGEGGEGEEAAVLLQGEARRGTGGVASMLTQAWQALMG